MMLLSGGRSSTSGSGDGSGGCARSSLQL